MCAKTNWNREPDPRSLLDEPIVRLLMTRDRVEAATLRDLWPKTMGQWAAHPEPHVNSGKDARC